MKKLFSLLLSVILLITVVFCPAIEIPEVSAAPFNVENNSVIENTFDEGWSPLNGSNTLLNVIEPSSEDAAGSNGNALQFNKPTTVATQGNDIRHYKIYNPEKVGDGYVAYKPSVATTYKLTFRYRTRSINTYNIQINVRGVANDTVGDVLCRAVTVKPDLGLNKYTSSETPELDYKWDTAVAYFTTPEAALQALAVSVEYSRSDIVSTGSSFNVAIDDLKLEIAPSNFVLANTFEEDDVTVDTINLGEDTTVYKNSSIDVSKGVYNHTTTNASTLRTNRTLAFRATRSSSNTKKVRYEIYDYSKGLVDNKLQSFVPEVGSNYRITFDYKVARSTSTNITYTIRPVTVDDSGDRVLGNAIATAVSIPQNDTNHPTPSTWKTATLNVPITSAVDGLALTLESGSDVGTYTTLDNIIVHKYDSDVIVNDYEETLLGKKTNGTVKATTKITGANVYHLDTKSTAAPNTSRFLQFNSIKGQTDIENGNITYVEIYNPYDTNFAGFKPTAGTYYKLSFDFYVKSTTGTATIDFNLRGKTGTALGDIIVNAASMPAKVSEFEDYKWGYATVVFNTEDTLDYETLALTVESSTTSFTYYPGVDNIKLEKIEDINAETSVTVYHDSEIYGKEKETKTWANLTELSEITFEDTEYAKFEGLYFDSAYTMPAKGVVFGETVLYAKWKDVSTFINTYDDNGGLTKTQLNGNGVLNCNIIADVAPNETRVVKINGVLGQNEIAKGNITHIEIYNPNDENFAAEEKLSSYSPFANSVYKITFDYFVNSFKDADISFDIRGKKDGTFSDILGTAVVIQSGDPNYSSATWNQAEVYIYTGDVEYDALALCLESAGKYKAGNYYPYIDNITVKCVKEYRSGKITSIAPAEDNKNGLMVINDGKWLEVAENDDVKVSFKLTNPNQIQNSRVVANIVADDGTSSEVTLFEFSENKGERLYSTTFKAPIAGKVVISVYKNDNTTLYQSAVISDLTVSKYTPSILKGDANLDENVNVVDLFSIKKKVDNITYTVNGDYLVASDFNKNGNLDDDDCVNVRDVLFDRFEPGTINMGINYEFANATSGSAEGTIKITSKDAIDSNVEIYWGNNDKPLDNYYYIGSTKVVAGQMTEFAMDSHLAIPDGATQIIVNDGLGTMAFDITKRYDEAFKPDKISLVKDYTANKNESNIKIAYDGSLLLNATLNGCSETYDLICEFRNKLSDILGTNVELVVNSGLNSKQNYIVVSGSTDVTTGRDNNDYHGDFAISSADRRISINAGNDYALQFAFDYFLDTYCANGNTAIPNDINYVSSDELKTITLADVDINNYTIVYPKNATVLEVDAAKYLAANILKATGKEPMSIVNDATAEGAYEILIGHTNRTDTEYVTTADTKADNSYTITVEANKTIITGGTNSAVNASVIDFVNRLSSGSLAIGTYEGEYDGRFSLTNGFKLTWSDEFNGTALSTTWKQLDLTYSTVAGGNVEWDNSNATVGSGALNATVSKIADTNNTTGISLDTDTNKLVKYGYFEARIKSFDELGFINGFWGTTIGEKANFIDGVSGTYYGEFDILEMYEDSNVVKPNLHNHGTEGAASKNYLQGDSPVVTIRPSITVENMGSQYHNFAMQWTDDYIYFYLDGVKYFSFDCTTSPEYDVFDMATRIRLTFSAGKYITPTVDSDEAFVDWVRVWQKNEAGYLVK
ncbi:MAG: family 16 glycosylhydrolase [Clostridia bacterium]|nr:family 16 glycosylhydrolase [Clostridia bacterium]